ncbi:response regulator [Erythrobacter alti]|uniref:response regulator n=1 Tax=Erythrobacter alti TaxID=1896145 RepID=UPI0030F39AED
MPEKLRVLVVEDELLLSMMLEDMLDELGVHVAGVATGNAEALAAIRGVECNCVLLDMHLNGERGDPIAEELKSRAIPFAILSGGPDTSADLGAVTFVPKPYKFAEIERAVAELERELAELGEG